MIKVIGRCVLPLLALPLITAAMGGSTAGHHALSIFFQEWRDTSRFEPDGYFVPMARPAPPLANLHHLEVRTHGETDRAGRRADLAHPLVTITFKVTAGDLLTGECGRARITRDSLSVTCPLASRGIAAFHLALLDGRGRYWELEDYNEKVREVARGRVESTGPDYPAVAQVISFYYRAGH